MNWFKQSQVEIDIKTIGDRNILNEKIHYLQNLSDTLSDIIRKAFQSQKLVKDVSESIIYHKKISSFPNIREMVIEANRVALDSPWKFRQWCDEAKNAVDMKVAELLEVREKFNSVRLPEMLEELHDK